MTSIVARRHDTLRSVAIEIHQGRIAALAPTAEAPGLALVAPGLVDLQINGYGGIEFNDPRLTSEQVRQVALSQDAFGITSFLATATTDSHEVLAHSLATIAAASDELPEVAARIPGIHLEGPFISPDDGPRGAHPRQHVRPPDWNEFSRLQDAATGRIKLVTLSPEYDGAADFIRRAARAGVLVAIGHTQATSDQIASAVDAGARMGTHLGNGAHPRIRRHPNYIWDQLAEDRLVVSLITDGHHLPPAVVKTMIRAKSARRVVLVSDITGMGGMPPGRYQTGLGELEVLPSGKLVPAGQPEILAGASLPLHGCVANAIRWGGIDLATAIEMASSRPAALIGQPAHTLDVGSAANLVLFDLPAPDSAAPLAIRATLNGGAVVFGSV
ncbi:MAG: amidohydrolase family protein [Pirellulaceae bacterium]